MGVSVSTYKRGVKKLKNATTEDPSHVAGMLRVYPEFIELIKILPYRRIIVVKPPDLCAYLGACDHYERTCLGWLLSFLAKSGLAVRHNNSRPRRYTLGPQFAVIKQICRINEHGEDYCVEKGCGLLGLCPYWVIKGLRSEGNGDL